MWCDVMEGGDSGEYSHGVLKSMMNDKCHIVTSFSFVGNYLHTWMVTFVCGQYASFVGGMHHLHVICVICGHHHHWGVRGGCFWVGMLMSVGSCV